MKRKIGFLIVLGFLIFCLVGCDMPEKTSGSSSDPTEYGFGGENRPDGDSGGFVFDADIEANHIGIERVKPASYSQTIVEGQDLIFEVKGGGIVHWRIDNLNDNEPEKEICIGEREISLRLLAGLYSVWVEDFSLAGMSRNSFGWVIEVQSQQEETPDTFAPKIWVTSKWPGFNPDGTIDVNTICYATSGTNDNTRTPIDNIWLDPEKNAFEDGSSILYTTIFAEDTSGNVAEMPVRLEQKLRGCTDPNALNFNEYANTPCDEGCCEY